MSVETANGPTELNLAEVHVDRRNADMILSNDKQVFHFEFQRRADPAMADRMLTYRSLIRVEPAYAGKQIQQHVIVLGEGTSPSMIDEPPHLQFRFETHYARDLDPANLLDDPVKAPWAVLAPADDDGGRAARLVAVMRTVTAAEPESLAQDLVDTTLTFASVVMKREDIKRALREAGMSQDSISKLTWAEEFVEEGRIEGERRSTEQHLIRVLTHRGIDEEQATPIAQALIRQGVATSVERAAFDDLDQLKALIGLQD